MSEVPPSELPVGLAKHRERMDGRSLSDPEAMQLGCVAGKIPRWLSLAYRTLPFSGTKLHLPQSEGEIGFGEFAVVLGVDALVRNLESELGIALLSAGWVAFAQGVYIRGGKTIYIPDVLCVGVEPTERRVVSFDRSAAFGDVEESLLDVYSEIDELRPL